MASNANIAGKDHLWMGTSYFLQSLQDAISKGDYYGG
jgi:hypothetical protein